MAAIVSPGTALLFFIKTRVRSGRTTGPVTGPGLGLAAGFWALVASLGRESLFAVFPWLATSPKIADVPSLLWIAVHTWLHTREPPAEMARPAGSAFISGLPVNAGNPKAMLVAAAVIVVVFSQGLTDPQIAWIGANHFMPAIGFCGLLSLLVANAPARHRYLHAKSRPDRIAASISGAPGLRLLFER